MLNTLAGITTGVRRYWVVGLLAALCLYAFAASNGQAQGTQEQTVTFAAPSEAAAGEDISVSILYSTTPADTNTTGIAVDMHYDSSKLTWDETDADTKTGFQSGTGLDEDNDDGDTDTDKIVRVSYSDSGIGFPGFGEQVIPLVNEATCMLLINAGSAKRWDANLGCIQQISQPITIYTTGFTTASNFSGSTKLRFTSKVQDSAAGYTIVDTDFATITAAATPAATLVLTPASISENGGVSTVTATLDPTSTSETTLEVSAAAVSPAVSGDFTLSSNTELTIAAGDATSTGTVTITAVNNDVDAADKTVTRLRDRQRRRHRARRRHADHHRR